MRMRLNAEVGWTERIVVAEFHEGDTLEPAVEGIATRRLRRLCSLLSRGGCHAAEEPASTTAAILSDGLILMSLTPCIAAPPNVAFVALLRRGVELHHAGTVLERDGRRVMAIGQVQKELAIRIQR